MKAKAEKALLLVHVIFGTWASVAADLVAASNKPPLLSNGIPRDGAVLSKKANVPGLIVRSNYTLETHEVITEDGYILTLHRIAGAEGSTPVLLQHGLLVSSALWFANENSLVYVLSDLGYDVWLGNARGNTYSRKHRTLSPSDPQFWNFTWEEFGRYDLPAVITYITKLKNQSLFYVGFSMGGTSFSVMAIERPDIARNVKAMIGLAPATYMYHIRSPLKLIAPHWDVFQRVLNSLGIYEFVSHNFIWDFFANYICKMMIFQNSVCNNLLYVIGGFSPKQLDFNFLPTIWAIFPAGTSVKLYTHWMQQMVVNDLRRFDYGKKGNLQMYNSPEPPKFDLSKVQVPAAVFYAKNDWLVGEEDALHFYEQLPMQLGVYKVDDDLFNHWDFLTGKGASKLVYPKVIDIIQSF